MRVRPLLGCVVCLAFAAPQLGALDLAAQPKAATDEATRRYLAGRKLLEQGKPEEALHDLEASMKELPSPNTELLIGHALRQVGRRGEAMEAYERVIGSAGARIREGETRYRPTLEEAGRWGAVLRADLGEIDVVVPNAPKETVVTLDGRELSGETTRDGLTARAWGEPGSREIAARAADGRQGTTSATATAGSSTRVVVRLAMPAPTPEPVARAAVVAPAADAPDPPSASEGSVSPPPVPVWIAAGTGVAGLAVFGIFGAMSAGRASDLDACSPSCPESKRADADAGRRDQTIANVGLVVGAVGLATAGVLWIVLPKDEKREAAARPTLRF